MTTGNSISEIRKEHLRAEAYNKAKEDKLELTPGEIPQYLPSGYSRKCADEDGIIQEYRVATHSESYIEGAKAQRDKALKPIDSPELEKGIRAIVVSNLTEYHTSDGLVKVKIKKMINQIIALFPKPVDSPALEKGIRDCFLGYAPDVCSECGASENLQKAKDRIIDIFVAQIIALIDRYIEGKIEEANKAGIKEGQKKDFIYQRGYKAGAKEERERIIALIESHNSIGYAYGADYKEATKRR